MGRFKTPKLAINVNSWHYRYYSTLRRIWGCGKPPARTSLCPYVQTTIWLTVLTFISSPVIALGWLWVNAIGFTTGYLRKLNNPYSLAIARVIEKSLVARLAGFFSQANETTKETASVYGVAGLLVVALIGLGGSTGWYGKQVVNHHPEAIYYVTAVPTYIGWAVSQSALYAGAGLSIIAWGISWAIVHGGSGIFNFLTSATTWQYVGWALVRGLSAAGAFTVFIFFITWFGHLPFVEGFFRRLGRVYVRDKPSPMQVAMVEAPPKPPREWPRLRRLWSGFKSFFISSTAEVASGTVKVMSPMAVVVEFLWALKKQACPLVEFVEVKERQS